MRPDTGMNRRRESIVKMNGRSFAKSCRALILAAMLSAPAQAHLMVAQHGTLNFVDDAAFMVLSLPMSAFEGVDDDGDGKISMIEFNSHRTEIVEAVRENVVLSDAQVRFPLEGIMLSPVLPHDQADQSVSQLTVMGKFLLADASPDVAFRVNLFGKQSAEQSLKITATQPSTEQEQVFHLTPAKPSGQVSGIR